MTSFPPITCRVSNVKMFLHYPDQFRYTSNRVSYSIDISKKTQYQITLNNHYQLERLITRPDSQKVKTCSSSKFDDCFNQLEEARMKAASEDNCTTPW